MSDLAKICANCRFYHGGYCHIEDVMDGKVEPEFTCECWEEKKNAPATGEGDRG